MSTTSNVRHWLLRFEEAHRHELDAADELHLSKVRALISRFPEPERVCISCEQPEGQPHLPTCVTQTGTLGRKT